MMLRVPDSDVARRIREFFTASGYSERNLNSLLGRTSPLYLSPDEKQSESGKLGGAGASRTLLELFFLEQAVGEQDYSAALPASVRDDLLAAGLVSFADQQVFSTALVVPVGDLLVAGDRFDKLPAEAHAEHVLSVNPPARFLARVTLRRPVARLLDLCAGNGVQALTCAKQAREIVATDLNPRALDFARFNAALNGIDHVELRQGPSFEPVCGERFDQIVCNPPYILTPSKRFMCTDNNQELDGFCRALIAEAPGYLEEGGVLQMICEWVQLAGGDWRERPAEWFAGSGCDAWVICSGHSGVDEYAKMRSQQTLADPHGRQEHEAEAWIDYFRDRGVTGIRSGFIQLRRRKGRNWQSFTSLSGPTRGAVGDSVAQGFDSRDRYMALGDADLLDLSPVPAPGVILRPAPAAAPGSARLVNTRGLPVSLVVNQAVRSMLGLMNGERSCKSISDAMAGAAGEERLAARRQCCTVIRELLSQGLVVTR